MLDFYLLGVARSGTSSLCHVLNSHSDIFCGMERFPIYLSPEKVKNLETFLDESIKGNPLGLKHSIENISSQDGLNIKCIGDKLPRKFYFPRHLNKTKVNLFLYREYADVVSSWNKRAENISDKWDSSRSGIFAILDIVICLLTLPLDNPISIVTYDEIYFGDYEKALEHIFTILNVDVNNFPMRTFKTNFYREKSRRKSSVDDPRSDDIARLIKLPQFEENLINEPQEVRIELIKQYRRELDNILPEFFDKFLGKIEFSENDELKKILHYLKKNFLELDDIYGSFCQKIEYKLAN